MIILANILSGIGGFIAGYKIVNLLFLPFSWKELLIFILGLTLFMVGQVLIFTNTGVL